MEGLLVIASVVLAVAWLLSGRPRERNDSPVNSPSDVGSERKIGSPSLIPVVPAITGAFDFDIAESHFDADDIEWFHDRYRDMEELFDDLGSRVNESRWPVGTSWHDGPSQSSGIGIDDGFLAHSSCINPATGLPMISGNEAGFDVGGNPYGFSNEDIFTSSDGFGSSMDSHGDSFGAFGGSDWH